ncbi:MAG: hypothetical protein ACREFO_02910 [Acetobacteraceae bacterium]
MKHMRTRIAAFIPASRAPSRWRRTAPVALRLSALTGVLLILAGCVHRPLINLHDNISFLDPQGPIAAAERWHFWFVIAVLVVLVAGPVFLFTTLIVWRYRYSNRAHARYQPKWGDSKPVTVLTWAGPIAIVIVLGFFVWQNTHQLNPFTPLAADHLTAVASSQAPLQIQAIGYDWKWLFVYPKLRIASVGVLPIQAGRPVAMQLTSATVMQSLGIPALVGQIYAMGGMTTQLHFEATNPGRSLGMNTMYNGRGFSQQKFTTIAMKPAAFKAWVRSVRSNGIKLNAGAYKLLNERNTKSGLAAALELPATSIRDGTVYFRNVPPHLFARVVRATMHGVPVNLNQPAGVSPGMQPNAAPPAVAVAEN